MQQKKEGILSIRLFRMILFTLGLCVITTSSLFAQLLQEQVKPQQPTPLWGRYTVETIPDSGDSLLEEEAIAILDRAEEAILKQVELSSWELVQGAYLFLTRGNPLLTHRLARTLLQRFNQMEVSEQELFNLVNRLGRTRLAALLAQPDLAPESQIAVERLLQGYNTYLKRFEGNEAVVLWKPLVSSWEKINAANQISKGGRIEIATVLLKQFLETDATGEELAEIAKKLGTADLLRLSTVPELQPEGQRAAQRIRSATQEARSSTKRTLSSSKESNPSTKELDPSSKKLNPSTKESSRSTKELQQSGIIVAEEAEYFGEKNALAVLLQQGDTENLSKTVKQLASLIVAEEAYLLYPGLFDSQIDSRTRAEIADSIRRLRGRVPTEQEAALTLYGVALDYWKKNRRLSQNEEGETVLWTFDPELRSLRLQTLPLLRAYVEMFVRFATAAYNIDSVNPKIRILYYIALCEQTIQTIPQDDPVDLMSLSFLEQLTRDDLETILVESIDNGYSRAGVISAKQLGHLGSVESLLLPKLLRQQERDNRVNRPGTPRILVQATGIADRRIRYAALEAVMQLNPTQPYPGSSLVSDALLWFASAEGKRLAVIGTPKITDGMKLVGFLAPLGYEGKVATTNQEVFREAARSPDVELVLVDERLHHPLPRHFAQTMWKDIRTKEIPIAIITKESQVMNATPIDIPFPLQSEWERTTSNTTFADSYSMILPYPSSQERASWVVQRLLDVTGSEPVPASIRLQQAQQSLIWLTKINRLSSPLYRIENLDQLAFRSAYAPVLAENGIALLATIRSKEAQQQLVELAISDVSPDFVRQQATTAFAENVQSFGVLLRDRDREQLWKQYQTRSNPYLDLVIVTIFGETDSGMR
ncbi:MAG: hypothetical protein ACRC10_05175 [Thermoguttaceae bacterium]